MAETQLCCMSESVGPQCELGRKAEKEVGAVRLPSFRGYEERR